MGWLDGWSFISLFSTNTAISETILTLTMDQVEAILVRISGRDLPTHQIQIEIGKTSCGRTGMDGRTYGQMDGHT